MNRRDRIFFGVSLAYAVLIAACAGALALMPYLATEPIGHDATGCHLTGDQLIFGATCHAFPGAVAAEALLSLPLALFLLPLAALGAMSEAAEVGDVGRLLLGAAGLGLGVSLWAPLVYFVTTLRRVTSSNARSEAAP